jgi:hypothetical protein
MMVRRYGSKDEEIIFDILDLIFNFLQRNRTMPQKAQKPNAILVP